ncbi:hypothetical protein B7486_00470 [cyanobacterium TDX16]|nr:hypothetical protein B7486_00470 [cyanobacterium TDX16]
MMPDMLFAPHTIATSPPISPSPLDRRAAIVLCMAGFVISAVCGMIHKGGILHFDDLTHFLYAKWAWTWPAYLVNDWGRPGFTALYALPASFGWGACRISSAALTAASAYLAWSISARLGMRSAWGAVIFAFAQPLFFQLSQTTLTETALAFYLILATRCALSKHWTISSVVLSLALVTRHEAIVFLPIWLYYAAQEKRALRKLWPLLWAPLAVNLLAWAAGSKPAIEQFLNPTGTGQYGRGGWLTFFCRSMEAFGPGVCILAMIGIARLPRIGGSLIAASIAIYFTAQTAVRALGLYDTGGYARFLVGISPLIAIAALAGWNRLFERDAPARRRTAILVAAAMALLWLSMERQLVLHGAGDSLAAELPKIDVAVMAIRFTTIAVILVTLSVVWIERSGTAGRFSSTAIPTTLANMIVLAASALCGPLRPPPEAAIIADVRRQLRSMGHADQPIISACVWMDYVTGHSFPPWRPTLRQELESAPPGTLFAWERQFAESADHNLPLADFAANPRWRLILESPPLPNDRFPYMHIFLKQPAPGP